jgi:hypothetical protein
MGSRAATTGAPTQDRKVSQMFTQFKKAVRALRIPNTADLEQAYLAEAGDRIDLEYRQRQVDNGMFRKNSRLGF